MYTVLNFQFCDLFKLGFFNNEKEYIASGNKSWKHP